MEIGSWAIVQTPSLLALIPLLVMIVLAFKGYHNAFACFCGIVVAAVLLGQDLGDLAGAFKASLGTSTALIGVIIMLGAGLGNLMTESGITRTLVCWIVKKIGVNSRTKAKICLCICSILICGMLGTLGGGNAIIAPIIIPIMASLGVVPAAVTVLFKGSGEAGLMLGPLTGVTLITMEVTGLSYGQLMVQAVIPFCIFWMAGTWVGANLVQKRLEGKDTYPASDGVDNIDSIVITPAENRNTVIFLIAFFGLVVYGILTKQATQYALMVMIVLMVVTAILARIPANDSMKHIIKGVASQAGIFLIFISLTVLLDYVELGGGFEALSELLSGLMKSGGKTGTMLIASVIGGFGIEAAAVAEIKIIADMFGELARDVGLPMGCFAVSILAATRVTSAAYVTSNMAGQMGTARCNNLKECMIGSWMTCAFSVFFVVVYSFVGPMILG